MINERDFYIDNYGQIMNDISCINVDEPFTDNLFSIISVFLLKYLVVNADTDTITIPMDSIESTFYVDTDKQYLIDVLSEFEIPDVELKNGDTCRMFDDVTIEECIIDDSNKSREVMRLTASPYFKLYITDLYKAYIKSIANLERLLADDDE